jgi:NADH-quinone oxidoreductase subunit J
MGTLVAVLVDAFHGDKVVLTNANVGRTAAVGQQLFSRFVMPFEVVSIVLLAALVGAVALARKDEAPR